MLSDYVTPKELADRTGLHEQTIRYHCRQGNIAAEFTSAIWLIPKAEADRFAEDVVRQGKLS